MTRGRSVWLVFVPGVSARSGLWLSGVFGIFFYLLLIIAAVEWQSLVNALGGHGNVGRDTVVAVSSMLIATYLAAVLPRLYGGNRHTLWLDVMRRFQGHRMAVVGLVLLLAFVTLSVSAPLLAPYDPALQTDPALQQYRAPSLEHPLGTDRLGRDLYSRTLYGARVSLSVGVVAVAIASLIGLLLGAFSGYIGGWVDDVVMRVVDGLLAFPRLLLVLTLLALFANSVWLVMLLLGVTGWMSAARLVRTEVIRLKESDFVQAAIATGARRRRVVVQHLVPNAIGPLIVTATLRIGTIILLEAYLSFLGLGVQSPTPSWGAMVFDGRDVLLSAWWVSAFPGLAIVLAVVACNLVGDGLRDAVDVRTPAS
jgi:peptide/nickel transport system permease protein